MILLLFLLPHLSAEVNVTLQEFNVPYQELEEVMVHPQLNIQCYGGIFQARIHLELRSLCID